MRTFFLQIFLSFWIATIGIFIGATVFFPNRDPGFPENVCGLLTSSAKAIATTTLSQYHEKGCAAFASLHHDFVLLNSERQSLCGQTVSPEEQQLAATAFDSGKAVGRRIHDQWVQARPVTLDGGERWFVLQRVTYIKRSWFPPLPNTALPISIVVTFLFAYALTRPVRTLSRAFRRFSDGNLSVRLPVSRNRWSEIGGADVQTLMLDFNDMADRVNELVDAQKLLIRDVSHELRSPLARLRMALEIARDDKEEIPSSLDRMEAEADRVNELIGQMLTLSLMESTGRLTQREEFSIDDMMEALLPDMKFEATAYGCTILYQKPREIPLMNGNPELFRRGVENVVRNAIRHTAPETAVEIEVSLDTGFKITNKLHNTTHVGGVRIQVRDRGPGVPESSLPDLFRAFYRTDAARQDSTGGFGVGLSIAERSIELHGGSIRAFNREGGGLVVDILVPFVDQLDLAFK